MASRDAASRRRTKIVCTLGPASSSASTIARLVRAGMNCARLNFSHGSPQEHLEIMRRVRQKSEETGRFVAVMQDLPGPKLRVGRLRGGAVRLATGSTVTLTAKPVPGDGSTVPLGSRELPRHVKTGDEVFLSDGSIKLRVVESSGTEIVCRCERGGVLLSGKGINVPGLASLRAFTSRDRRYLAFGLQHGVDLVAVSFVRTGQDIRKVREFVSGRQGGAKIVAKIEKKEAVDNIDEIVAVADGVMVARGDMGVENPIEQVPELQKKIISKCRSKAVPVITATQMLESMVSNASPTRAEVTDVANAILDGTDALMLSEETAVGEHPLECLRVMGRVALRAEEMMLDPERTWRIESFEREGPADALSESACKIARGMEDSPIAVQSEDETVLTRISRFRPRAPMLFVSKSKEKLRKAQIVWGVYQVDAEGLATPRSPGELVRLLSERGFVRPGEGVVAVRQVNEPPEEPGFSLSVTSVASKR